MTPRILVVVGTRPEAIKLAPVVHRLRASEHLTVEVCATGQHREMLQQAFQELDYEADWSLDLMRENQTLSGLTTRAISALTDLVAEREPAAVLVQGDTNSAFAGALAAFYNRVPTGHVEAGLRTDDLYSPYPEEMNRRLISPLARWHFAPTETARQNLLAEGTPDERIAVTGNTGIDALLGVVARQRAEPLEVTTLDGERRRIPAREEAPLLLVTVHRRENHGERLAAICRALRTAVRQWPEAHAVLPVHPNPNVQGMVVELLGEEPRVALLPPQNYTAFCALMARARLILTDSGGVQEEAPSLNVPVLVLRDNTERTEGVAAGTARLVGADEERIVQAVQELRDDEGAYRAMAEAANPYGDGRAASRIVELLEHDLAAHATPALTS